MFLEINEKENTNYQKMQDTAKASLRGKFIVLQAFIRKKERIQIRNLIAQLKKL